MDYYLIGKNVFFWFVLSCWAGGLVWYYTTGQIRERAFHELILTLVFIFLLPIIVAVFIGLSVLFAYVFANKAMDAIEEALSKLR